jgi:hypothetical protein
MSTWPVGLAARMATGRAVEERDQHVAQGRCVHRDLGNVPGQCAADQDSVALQRRPPRFHRVLDHAVDGMALAAATRRGQRGQYVPHHARRRLRALVKPERIRAQPRAGVGLRQEEAREGGDAREVGAELVNGRAHQPHPARGARVAREPPARGALPLARHHDLARGQDERHHHDHGLGEMGAGGIEGGIAGRTEERVRGHEDGHRHQPQRAARRAQPVGDARGLFRGLLAGRRVQGQGGQGEEGNNPSEVRRTARDVAGPAPLREGEGLPQGPGQQHRG